MLFISLQNNLNTVYKNKKYLINYVLYAFWSKWSNSSVFSAPLLYKQTIFIFMSLITDIPIPNCIWHTTWVLLMEFASTIISSFCKVRRLQSNLLVLYFQMQVLASQGVYLPVIEEYNHIQYTRKIFDHQIFFSVT